MQANGGHIREGAEEERDDGASYDGHD